MATINVCFYENSYLFKNETVEDSDVNTIKENVKRVLLAQFNYRNDGESLWCDVTVDDKQHGRYKFNPTTKDVELYISWKSSKNIGSEWYPRLSRVISETSTHYTIIYDEKTGQTSHVCKTLLIN